MNIKVACTVYNDGSRTYHGVTKKDSTLKLLELFRKILTKPDPAVEGVSGLDLSTFQTFTPDLMDKPLSVYEVSYRFWLKMHFTKETKLTPVIHTRGCLHDVGEQIKLQLEQDEQYLNLHSGCDGAIEILLDIDEYLLPDLDKEEDYEFSYSV